MVIIMMILMITMLDENNCNVDRVPRSVQEASSDGDYYDDFDDHDVG